MYCIGSRYTPPRKIPTPPRFFVATLFRFVPRFARVRIEDSSRNRFASTAYFAKPGTFQGEFSVGGIFRSPNFIRWNLSVTEINMCLFRL